MRTIQEAVTSALGIYANATQGFIVDTIKCYRDAVSKIASTLKLEPDANLDDIIDTIKRSQSVNASAFIVHKMVESKGESWWAFLACDETYSLAVSEVSSEDAVDKAKTFLASHGWKPEMGEEVGILLCKQYERGRLEDFEEREKPIARAERNT